jgi:hypothetical protein
MYSVSLDSIQMALALTVALAWYAFIKKGIELTWKVDETKVWAFGVYAVVMTALFALVLVFFKNVLHAPVQARPITYAVMPGV